MQVAADYRCCLDFHFQRQRGSSYQQQLNVKMFAGSQTKLWGDSVSTDGALFCSVVTALAHAGFHATICGLLLAQGKFATQTSSYTFYLNREGWLRILYMLLYSSAPFASTKKINQIM